MNLWIAFAAWMIAVVYFCVLATDACETFAEEWPRSGRRTLFMPSWRARRRSRKLLMEHLTPKQQRQFRLRGNFVVVGSSGIRYRVRQCYSGSIVELNTIGRAERIWCARVMGGRFPLPDQMLAVKLALEEDDGAFRRVAFSASPFGGLF